MKKTNLFKILILVSLVIFSYTNIVYADLCPNIIGNQVTLPANTVLINGQCVASYSTQTDIDAQEQNYNDETYEPLAPLPGLTGPLDFTKPCPLGEYLNTFINLFIGIVAVIAMIMIVMGGINYITSDLVSSKGEAKSSIQNAIFGLIIALASYLILNTLNPDLLKLCLDGIPKVSISIDEEQPLINGKYGNYTAGAKWDEALAGKITALPAGVKTNYPGKDCDYVGQRGCTSIRGLDPSIINNVASNCKNCDLIITGGTENWLHKTHDTGKPIIDLRDTPSLNKYITGSTSSPTTGVEKTVNGVKYTYEPAGTHSHTTGAHWHVTN